MNSSDVVLEANEALRRYCQPRECYQKTLKDAFV